MSRAVTVSQLIVGIATIIERPNLKIRIHSLARCQARKAVLKLLNSLVN